MTIPNLLNYPALATTRSVCSCDFRQISCLSLIRQPHFWKAIEICESFRRCRRAATNKQTYTESRQLLSCKAQRLVNSLLG